MTMNTATTAGGGTMRRVADVDDAKADARASTTTTAGFEAKKGNGVRRQR